MIDLTPLLGIGLLIIRPGTLILASPALGETYAPMQVKIGLTLFLTLAMLPTVTVPHATSAIGVAVIAAREMAIGLALSMAIRVLVAAAEFGGHLAGFQMGLSYAAIVDPTSGVRNNALATLYANVATITFFVTNAHHAFLRALGASYESLPIGAGAIGGSLPQTIVGMLGLIFGFGLRLAAPLVAVLVVVEIALGLISRSAPALNLMAVGGPVRLILGLLLFAVIGPAAVGLIAGMSSGALQAAVRAAEAFR